MFRFGMTQEPSNSVRVDTTHIVESFIELQLRCCSGCLPKKGFKLRVFEFIVEVLFEMFKTVRMRAARENLGDSFKKSFLTIGEEN